jgi:hypothetical protein
MSGDSNLLHDIVNHQNLSLPDLVNTFLVYIVGFIEKPRYEDYVPCRPALARIYQEDEIAFTLIAQKIKERFGIPFSKLSADVKTLIVENNGEPTRSRESQADLLLSLSHDLVLFHDEFREPYAVINSNGHQEIWKCRSKMFRLFLRHRFFQQHQKAPSTEAFNAALGVLEGQAVFDGQQYQLHNRVAWHDDAIWYDLSDSLWRAVKISAQGWEIVNQPPVLFRRYAHQASQVTPVHGGTLALLKKYANLTAAALTLLQVTLGTYLIPDIPHPGLHPHGQHGAGKSFLLRIVRQLIDPSQVSLLSFPNDKAELAQQLAHHYCPFYDNVSTIPQWISDALCRAVTGEGFTKRELYSDDDDVIYKFRRCIGLNGINVAATAPDLLDRLVLAEMNRIEADERKEEKTLWVEFEQDRPKILGALFDAVAGAIRRKPGVVLSSRPRMADFAMWGEAIAQELGYFKAHFIALYQANIQAQHQEVVRGHAVAAAIVELMGTLPTWEGTATELYQALVAVAEQIKLDTKDPSWPKAPNALTRRLKEVLFNLREVGITVSFGDDNKKRSTVRLEKSPEKPPAPPAPSNPTDSQGFQTGDISGDISQDPQNLRETSGSKQQQNPILGDAGDSGDISPSLSGSDENNDGDAPSDIYSNGTHLTETSDGDWDTREPPLTTEDAEVF